MFRRWLEKLKKLNGSIAAFIAVRFQKWNESSQVIAEREFRHFGFQELTPLEEARLRTGHWNPRW